MPSAGGEATRGAVQEPSMGSGWDTVAKVAKLFVMGLVPET